MTPSYHELIVDLIAAQHPDLDAEALAVSIEEILDLAGYEIILPTLSYMAEPTTTEGTIT